MRKIFAYAKTWLPRGVVWAITNCHQRGAEGFLPCAVRGSAGTDAGAGDLAAFRDFRSSQARTAATPPRAFSSSRWASVNLIVTTSVRSSGGRAGLCAGFFAKTVIFKAVRFVVVIVPSIAESGLMGLLLYYDNGALSSVCVLR